MVLTMASFVDALHSGARGDPTKDSRKRMNELEQQMEELEQQMGGIDESDPRVKKALAEHRRLEASIKDSMDANATFTVKLDRGEQTVTLIFEGDEV